MTDKLKNDLLKSNIQCINEYDGKFVFLLDELKEINTSDEPPIFILPVLFNNEIPVGSFLLAKVLLDNELKTLVFVCCNASSSFGMILPTPIAQSNLFWSEITNYGFYVIAERGD